MSYRKRYYRKSRSTRYVRQKYQYFVDMQTDPTKMQIINITAGGLMPQIRLRPFFGAFKYFKLGKVSVRFVAASTLPVDPTGLSYEVGEQTVDPRDQMNPGLVRITNGEDISTLTDILTGVDSERAYYATLLDPRWYKFNLQSGFKRTATPLLWNVGQTHQSVAQSFGLKTVDTYGAPVPSYNPGVEQSEIDTSSHTSVIDTFAGSADEELLDAMLMQTNRIRMGWMPTDMFNQGQFGPNAVPEINCITCVLPKAYKTRYFYRCYIEEEILFREPVSITPIVSTFTGSGESMTDLQYLNHAAIDRFILPAANGAIAGNNASSAVSSVVTQTNKLNGGSV